MLTGRLRVVLLLVTVALVSACTPSSPTPTASADDTGGGNATAAVTLPVAATDAITATSTTAATPTVATTADATPSAPATIEFSGEVTQYEGGFMTVSGLRVSLADIAVDSSLKVGSNVKISGILMPDTTVKALFIIIISNDQATLAPTVATAAPTVQTTVVSTQATLVSTPQTTLSPTARPTITSGGTIIVIEGPVQSINVNIITIYSFNIVLEPNDPLLTVIQVGDVIRVQGERGDDDDGDRLTLVLVAINIIFIDIDVFILDGRIWRDPGNCDPLPEWVDRAQVRRYVGRCGGGGGNSGGGNSGGGNSGGGGNNNNDDDD